MPQLDDDPRSFADSHDDLQATQERLARRRRELEEIERQQREMEEMARKRETFLEGHREIEERLRLAIARMDREIQDSAARYELLSEAKGRFEERLAAVRGIAPERWNPNDIHGELTRSLGAVEDMWDEYRRTMSRVDSAMGPPEGGGGSLFGGEGGAPRARDWLLWGLLFTLPLILALFGAVGLAAWLLGSGG